MINTEITQVTYLTRADQTTRYSIPFVYNKNELTDAPELTVTLNGSELVFGTDYTVNESGLQLVNAVEEGLELVITRTSVFEQLRDFQTGLIDPEQIEGGFDDSVMRDQELKRDVQKVAESLETETGERMTADTILQGAIDDEANARILADGTLQTNIDNEALARSNADAALQTAIDTKQDVLTAGNGIQIENDVIGVTDSVLMNQATAYGALNILGTEPTAVGGVSIGADSQAVAGSSVAVGLNAKSYGQFSVAVGTSSRTTGTTGIAVGPGAAAGGESSVAIGNASGANDYSIAIGKRAQADAICAVQISTAYGVISHTNNDANTFKFGNSNGNFEIVSANGTIPSDRLASGGTVGQILTKSASGMTWNSAPAIDGVQLTASTTKADLGLSNLYTFKGSVSTYSNLPSVGNVVGDVYNVEDTGKNYAWTANGWDSLGGEFTAPVSSVNGQTGAVVLGATDVGALPTTGGTMTGTILLNSGAKIEPTYSSAVLGSRQYPFDTVYALTLSGGSNSGTFYVPTADSATVGVFIGYVITMPTPSLANNTMVFQYLGDTDSNYTHGHFYQCKAQGTSPQTYAWEEIEVQEPGTSYTAGSGIDITNDVISTASDVLKNLASVSTSLNIGTTTSTDRGGATSVGINAVAGNWGTAVGHSSYAAPYALALGDSASAEANGAIQLSCGGGVRYNAVANTFKVGNSNGNYELMSADGTIPEARLADTTNAAQGQVLTLDSNLNAVWQASSDAVSSVNGQTGTVVLSASDVGALPTTGGTMTGTITLGSGANIVGNNRLINIGSSQYPIRRVYVDTLSGGDQYGRFMIPGADPSTFGFFIALVDPMPTARQDLEAMIFQYMGVTDSNYTHGYFYECVTDDNTTWYWKQLDVQPAGSSYTAGSGISIDANNEISVTAPTLTNTATGTQSATLFGTPTNKNYAMNIGLNSTANGDYSFAVGRYADANGTNTQVIGSGAAAYGDYDLVVGNGQIAYGKHGSIVIGVSHTTLTPVDESNVAVFMLDDNNYKILNSDGSIPTDRLAKNSILHYTIMPAATPDLSGAIAQYVGTTDSSYTNGYFYKCSQGASSATASQTTGGGLSDVAVVVATFETQATDSGSYEFRYSAADSAWIHDYLITDLADWGITYTGTPVDGDVITVVYDNGFGWTQSDVQPTQETIKVNTTVTLAAADWSSNTQTVSVTGMTTDGVVMVSPIPANQSAYTSAGILCTAQATGSLTFTCDTVPSADITVTVVML